MANIEQFNQIANNYQSEFRIALFELFKSELLKLEISGQVLDFGCGTGNLGVSIAGVCDSVCLLDPAPAMREIIARKIELLPNCYVAAQNFENGEQLNSKFDYIIVAQVLLHLPNYLVVLEQLISHLNVGGKLVIFDYLKNPQVSNRLVHNGFDIEQLIINLQALGVSVVEHRVIYEADNLLLGGYGKLFMLTAVK